MAIIFNKITKEWNSTESTENLPSDWLINPTFTDFQRCQDMGTKYWIYTNNNISCYSDVEIDTNQNFISEGKTKKLIDLENEFHERLYSTVDFNSHTFSVTEKLRTDIHTNTSFADKSLSGGLEWPTGFEWEDINGTSVPMTAFQMIQFDSTIFMFSQKCFQTYWAHKIAINSLTTLTTIKNYDIESNWPGTSDYSTPDISNKYLNSKSSNIYSIDLASNTSPYISKKSQTYNTVSRFMYPGVKNIGVASSIKVICKVTNNGTAAIRITNINTGSIVVEKTNITNSQIEIIDLGIPTALPNDPVVFELVAKTTADSEIQISSITIFF